MGGAPSSRVRRAALCIVVFGGLIGACKPVVTTGGGGTTETTTTTAVAPETTTTTDTTAPESTTTTDTTAGSTTTTTDTAVPDTAPGTTTSTTTAPDPTTTTTTTSVAPAPKKVAIYGDSLVFQATRFITADVATRAPDATLRMRSFGGTAACDWVTREASDIAGDHPGLVALQFSGNSFTGCMQDASGTPFPIGSDAYFAAYRSAITTLVTQATETGARVVWLSSPVMRGGDDTNRVQFAADATDAGAAYPGQVTVVDAGAAVMDHGQYTDTLPCLAPDEVACTDGMVPVRAADGVHFWFVDDDTAKYSPGAYRFAGAIGAAVTEP